MAGFETSRRRFLGTASAGVLLGTPKGQDPRTRGEQSPNERERAIDSNLDLGAVYIPFLGTKWDECIDHQPAVGQYDIEDSGVIDTQIAQMKQCGISTVLFNYGENERTFDRFRAFKDADRFANIDVEAFWAIGRIFERNLDFDRFVEFVAEEMIPLPNYKTIDGRPVVTFWSPGYLVANDDAKEQIRDEWGGLEGLFSTIRTELTVDGTEPFLVGDIGGWGVGGFPNDIETLGRQFDAITSWVASPDPGLNPWDEHREEVEESFRRSFWFAVENDLEFVPMVFPGFNDEPNSCWGDDRHVPRSPSHLAELFDLALKYRTTDRTYIATWNGWPEGHQIEPGTFDGHDYGTAYLDVVKDAATRTMPPFRIESFVPVTLSFDRTVEESEVNPDTSPEASRDLAFRCSELELLTADGDSVAAYNVGRREAEPQFTEGAYHTAQNDTRSTRWLGGPTSQTRLYFRRERIEEATELRVRGVPIANGIAADVLVDGTRTDSLGFERDGWQNYVADLRATTTASPATARATTTTQTRGSATEPGATTVPRESTGRTGTSSRGTTPKPRTDPASSTSGDVPGFGALTAIASFGTMACLQYWRSDGEAD
ncbi:glycoside hydrolase family 71/99 protein [Halorussus halophilus]|uniref:hypothetical protein n=1 Tax=Halorussus halophilus TaxID=2650975 RepID=UPI0013012CED|nr:hypothetical protein [Halorussus halophilus]